MKRRYLTELSVRLHLIDISYVDARFMNLLCWQQSSFLLGTTKESSVGLSENGTDTCVCVVFW